MKPAIGTLRVCEDAAALARAGADMVCEVACRGSERTIIALSGGSTPKPLYELLAQEPVVRQLPWERTHWVLGDERFVPSDDPASNYGMMRRAFLSHVPAPAANVHPVDTDSGVDMEKAADEYEAMLKALYGADQLSAERPLLDLTLLGMGPDGHTASLIPGEPVVNEMTRWVAGVGHGRPEPRITLTFPVLDNSETVMFLVSGDEKRAMLDRVLSGDTSVPAGRIRATGEVIWLVDKAAAGRWAD